MIRFLLLSIFLWSCAEDKQSLAPENSVSMIISSDSAIIYSGPLKKSTAYQKIAIDELKVKAILAKEKTKASKELSVLLKLSSHPMGDDGIVRRIEDLKNWSIESGIANIVFADMDAKDLAVFKLRPVPWAFIDSFRRPHSMQLTMPKDYEENKDSLPGENTISVILRSDKECWCYQGPKYGRGSLYSIEDAMQMIGQIQDEMGDSLAVIIKPGEEVNYKTLVDVLDLMSIHSIRNYKIGKLSGVEKIYEATKAFDPPEPVKTITSNSVSVQEIPGDNAFLIEIKKDNSVWYQPISPLIKMAPRKVNAPITKNLKDIIADYQRSSEGKIITYLLKGDGNATYTVFEQVINALKENNIYKYNLVTSEN